jgi:hypothetical protein
MPALAGQGRSSLEAADGWNAQRASADGCRSEGQVPGVADVDMAAQMNMLHIVHDSTCIYIYIIYIYTLYIYIYIIYIYIYIIYIYIYIHTHIYTHAHVVALICGRHKSEIICVAVRRL